MEIDEETGMKKVALEDILTYAILIFCENLAEIGCPKDKECDMWFRELSDDERYSVAEKILDIEEKNYENFMVKYECRPI